MNQHFEIYGLLLLTLSILDGHGDVSEGQSTTSTRVPIRGTTPPRRVFRRARVTTIPAIVTRGTQQPSVAQSAGLNINGVEDDYCKVSKRHTMCMYKAQNQTGKCGEVKTRTLTDAEKKKIVDDHNTKRKTIATGRQDGQASVANMIKLVWDVEAADIAQRWADQCTMEKDQERSTITGKVIPNGQSAYYMKYKDTWPTKVDIKKVVDRWLEDTGSMYTEMVAAETVKVGCGYVVYGNREEIFMCNYSPASNYFGRKTYKSGPACSMCPADMKKCDGGLCST